MKGGAESHQNIFFIFKGPPCDPTVTLNYCLVSILSTVKAQLAALSKLLCISCSETEGHVIRALLYSTIPVEK